MAENATMGATANGERIRETTAEMRDTLRSKASAVGDRLREQADTARSWARGRLDNIQSGVEANPWRASAWALGIGFVAGALLTGMLRGRR